MKKFEVQCPECNHKFSPDAALQHHISHLLDADKKALNEKWRNEQNKIQEREKQLIEKEENITLLVQKELQTEKEQLVKYLTEKIRQEQNFEMKALKADLEEKQQKINAAKDIELQYEKLKRESIEREKELQIQMERQLSEEREKIEEAISRSVADKFELSLAEKDKKLQDLTSKLADAQRQAKQGSAQLQGEVQELAIQNKLRELYPSDIIDEVAKGCNGADCVQTVVNSEPCGNIIYESKRTKRFDTKWIGKLREDQQRVNAGAAILVTEALPDAAKNGWCIIDGVVICSYSLFEVVACFIRMKLIALRYEQLRNKNRQDSAGLIYQYLTGNEFRMHLEEVVKGCIDIKNQVEQERRAFEKQWKQREKHAEKIMLNVSGIYGSLKGIAGSAIKDVKLLEL